MVKIIASAKVSRFEGHRPIIDTIIKLDSVRDKKLLKGKKSAATLRTKNSKASSDTTKKDKGGLKSIVTAHAERTLPARTNDVPLRFYTSMASSARVTYTRTLSCGTADYIKVNEKDHTIYASGQI